MSPPAVGRRPGAKRRLTDADLVTLAVLVDAPTHGHGIWTRLADCDVEDWAAVSRAQVYYSLGKLAEQQLIQPETEPQTSGGRQRCTWKITAQGRRALTRTLASEHWASQRCVPPFLTWVALSTLARPTTRRRVLRERRTFLDRELARERETLEQVHRLPMDNPVNRVTLSMVEQVIRQIKLELTWLDELNTILEF